MSTFLENLVHKLINEYSGNMESVCVVLPNRRARVFLKHALEKAIDKPVWMPEVFGMEDFIARVSGKNILSSFSLLFELFQVRKKLESQNRTIDEFIHWGHIILSDFNEIDLYEVDVDALFDNLSEVKAIEKWHPGEELTDMERNYLYFYASLKKYYYALKEHLGKKNQAWQGNAFRHVSENIDSLAKEMPWQRIIFAGFNALSASEKNIISYLEKNDLAESVFDADEYYLNDPRQEAGMFLRELQKKYKPGEFSYVSNGFKSKKNISIVRSAGKITMAKSVTQLLQQLQITENADDSALVLVDENLLIPVISAVPESIGAYNVTMGYRFTDCAAADFISAFLELYANAEYNSQTYGRKTYFHRFLIQVFNHPYMQFVPGFSVLAMQKLIIAIRTKNQVMYSVEDLMALDVDLSEALISLPGAVPSSPQQVMERLKRVFLSIHDVMVSKSMATGEQKLDYEFVCQAIAFLNKLSDLVDEFPDVENIRILKVVAQRMMQDVKVPFVGEPLSGLQVMGMLETRTLDFKNVILLSVNEGLLPAAKSYKSLIPYDLKRHFGIPGYHEKQAVFAYHFYRLLQNAENIYCLYDTSAEQMGKGEPSRFLLQLQQELPRYNPQITIKTYDLQDSEIPEVGEPLKDISKSPEILHDLSALFERGLAPTTLNTYRNCPLKFALHHVMNVKEHDEVEESVDHRTFGLTVHKTLEELYKPLLNKILVAQDLDHMLKDCETVLRKAFDTEYAVNAVDHGKNMLAFNAALTFVRRALRFERKRISDGNEIIVTHLEEKLIVNREIALPNDKTVSVLFKGTADRIEKCNGVTVVIDYKTGRVDNVKSKKADLLAVLSSITMNNNIDFQLMMYSWLYFYSRKETQVPNAGAWALKLASDPLKMLSFPDVTDALSLMETFSAFLDEVIVEMLDDDEPFTKTTDIKNCSYCPFAGRLCQRDTL